MSLKALAEKVLERNAQRNTGGKNVFHPPEKKAPEKEPGGTGFYDGKVGSKAVLLRAPDGVPGVWGEGVADLLAMSLCPAWGPERWRVLQEDAHAFIRTWGVQAHRLGWTELDLFGAHRTHPWARLDSMGLVPLLGGRTIAAMTESEAAIKTAIGGTLTYYRKEPPYPAECCLIWEL